MPARTRLAWIMATALALAVLANGCITFMKRVGLADPAAYRGYWTAHCDDTDPRITGEWQCARYTTREAIARHHAAPQDTSVDGEWRFIYDTTAGERLLKLAKDLFWLVLLGVSLLVMRGDGPRLPQLRNAQPVYALAALAALGYAAAVVLHGPLAALVGLRAFAFLGAALLCGWLGARLEVIALAIAGLIGVHVLLMPLEIVWGIHMFHAWPVLSLAKRAAGLLVLPGGLGVFAVAGCAFCWCFLPPHHHLLRRAMLGGALLLVMASGSATGMVVAAGALAAWLRGLLPARSGVTGAALLALAAGVGLALPALTGRHDVFTSIGEGGRFTALVQAATSRPPLEVVLGSGLGAGSNLLANVSRMTGPGSAPAWTVDSLPADSTLTDLLLQLGVVGVAAFYGLLAWAALRDRQARVFHAVLAVCSLTVNVTELFPVNVLMGLCLARACHRPVPQAQRVNQAGT